VAVETERGSAANQARLGSCGDVLGHLMKPTHDSRASVRPAIASSAVAAYDRHNNEQVGVARQQELRTSLVRPPRVRIGETPASPPDGTGDQQPMALRHLQSLSPEAARLTVNVHVPVIDRAKKGAANGD
jgi:hypothetical protein